MFKKTMMLSVASLLISVCAPIMTLAAGTKDLEQQEAAVQGENISLGAEIETALTEVNQTYRAIDTLRQDIDQTEKKISTAKTDIEETEASINKRMEVMASRFQEIQTNRASFDVVQALLDAESVTELVNRLFAVRTIQNAETDKVNALASDKDRLAKLKETLQKNQEGLITKKATLETESAVLSSKTADLRNQLKDNKEVLAKLSSQRTQLEEKAKQAELQALAEAEKSSDKSTESTGSTSNSSSEESTNRPPASQERPPAVAPVPPANNNRPQAPSQPESNNEGQTVLTVEATAYSYREEGLTYFTALGIDLRENPNVIAVDPRVIPLGTLVEVSGYGFAIAGDTGGAIIGHKIDVHFPTVEQCIAWGRRTVTVTFQ